MYSIHDDLDVLCVFYATSGLKNRTFLLINNHDLGFPRVIAINRFINTITRVLRIFFSK